MLDLTLQVNDFSRPAQNNSYNLPDYKKGYICYWGRAEIDAETTKLRFGARFEAQIVALCEKHKVVQLFVFGSILTDRYL